MKPKDDDDEDRKLNKCIPSHSTPHIGGGSGCKLGGREGPGVYQETQEPDPDGLIRWRESLRQL
jgi:hypothetical protein